MISGKNIRGLEESDNHFCPLVLDDMAVAGDSHYPCIIYLREQGEPIGKFKNLETVRQERKEWSEKHDCMKDPICKNNCLDVCREYSNKWREYHHE